MPRNKVKIAYIEKRDQRKASFNKRKDSLFKKMNELSILCDVKLCAIIYSPYKKEVEIWPTDNDGVVNVINTFMEKSEITKEKKMNTQESSIKKKSDKLREQIDKQKLENREIELTNMMVEYLSGKVFSQLNATDLKDLASFVGQKVSEVDERLQLLDNKTPAPPPPHESQMAQKQQQKQQQQQQQQPQEVVHGGNSNNANDVVAEGSMDDDCYVPAAMENPGGDSDEMQTAGGNPDWFKDLVRLDVEFDRMVKPFSDDESI